MKRRYYRYAGPPPPGLLESGKGDVRAGELEGKELHAWGGGGVRASKGGGIKGKEVGGSTVSGSGSASQG
eukprot:3709996-Prorocentrum_lima.AAC.1